jgi:hypothetical protein
MHAEDGSIVFRPVNPCPICGAETALAEIESHPLHCNFEIHGYLCDRCGPVKSLVVMRTHQTERGDEFVRKIMPKGKTRARPGNGAG